MASHLPLIASVSPFLLFTVLMFRKRASLFRVSLATLAATAALSVFYWNIAPSFLYQSFGKGLLVALDILVIIAGAIFLLEILQKARVIDGISVYLESFSKDYRVQIILLAWFFEAFIEGTAGFGTPGAIVAPLLVGLGLSPLQAVIVALLGNSSAVVFGAAGTPIRTGFAGLDIAAVPLQAAILNCVGFIIPAFMVWAAAAGRPERKKEFLEALPFAVWSGLAFLVPSIAVTYLFGQELPSILGAAIGLFLVAATTKLGIFAPKTVRTLRPEAERPPVPALRHVIAPYALLILFLIAGKFLLGTYGFVIPFGLNHAVSIFNPGLAFILTGAIMAVVWRKERVFSFQTVSSALKRTVDPFLVIVFMSTLVQLLINSGQNGSGLPSAVTIIGTSAETAFLPFLAPFIGAFGSFLTGSATVSDLLFGNLFKIASELLSMDTARILALGVVGASAGNMIALADMLSAEAVVGLKNQERSVLSGVLLPCLIVVALAGIVGLLIA